MLRFRVMRGLCVLTVVLLICCRQSHAADAGDTRCGALGLLDNRSQYGKGVFPEPFIVDDTDREANEFRLDWTHRNGNGHNANLMRAEFEKGLGAVTLELEVPYEYDTSNAYDPSVGQTAHSRVQGFDNITLIP